MSKVSFEEIGALVATFTAEDEVEAGQVVMITDNGEVGLCDEEDDFCGVALSVRGGCAAVQCKGFVTLKSTGTVSLGWQALCADGDGGVQAAESGGVTVLVVSVDATEHTCVVCL